MAAEQGGVAAAGGKNVARTAQRTPQRTPIRRRNTQAMTDKFYVDPRKIPPGMDYQWKRVSILGKEDTEHQIDMTENGAWSYVPAERHPELAGRNAKPGAQIIRGGDQVLMERPKELSKEAEAEDKEAARAQVRAQAQRLGMTPEGTMSRAHKKAAPRVNRSFETGIEVDPSEDEEG